MPGRSKILYALLFLLAALAVFAGGRITFKEATRPDTTSSLYGWDTAFYYFWLRSAVLDRDLDFENEVQLCDSLPQVDKDYATNGIPRTDTGLISNKYPIGWAVFHVPWFVLGHGAALAADSLGMEVRTDGFGKVYESFLYFGSVFYACVSLWLTLQLLLRFFDKRVAWTSLVLVWTSSFLIFYQLRQYGMAHGLTYLCLVSAFYWSLAIREFPPLRRNWMMLGASVGLLLITRYQAGVYLVFPLFMALEALIRRRAKLGAALACLSLVAVPVAVQLAAWKMLYGTWLVYTYQGEGFVWDRPELFRSLFDSNHGLFYWHPVFLLGLIGLVVFVFSRRVSLSWTWFVSIGLVYIVNAAWHCWWFGYSFGNRSYEGVTLFVFLGVATLLAAVERAGVPRFFAACLYGILFGLSVWNIGLLDVVQVPWVTGISLQGAESYRDLALAIWERWF